MKTLRPLLVGIALAALWIIAYTTWQLTRVRGGGQSTGRSRDQSAGSPAQGKHVWKTVETDSSGQPYAEQRRQMVEQQLEARDIPDQRVLETMLKVPRHLFVPDKRSIVPMSTGRCPSATGRRFRSRTLWR